MQFIHTDLGSRSKREIVEITLTNGANVRLMDSSNFNAYKVLRRQVFKGNSTLRIFYSIVVLMVQWFSGNVAHILTEL